jgi:glycerophosphoryl diester phosphodiesterase
LIKSLPTVIGHRGAAAYAPENTLASFRAAAALGCRMVEFDVRLSADGVPLVFHDDRLERTSTGSGRVGEHSLAHLKTLDAGGWFAAAFAGETIPTLAEVLTCCAGLGLAVNMEIKPDPGHEAETAIAALAVAGQMWPADLPPPLISSFQRPALVSALAVAPHWPRGLLVETLPQDWREAVGDLDCCAVHAAASTLKAPDIAALRAAGLQILAYTVNNRDRAEALWQAGVAAVFSDAPDRVIALS